MSAWKYGPVVTFLILVVYLRFIQVPGDFGVAQDAARLIGGCIAIAVSVMAATRSAIRLRRKRDTGLQIQVGLWAMAALGGVLVVLSSIG